MSAETDQKLLDAQALLHQPLAEYADGLIADQMETYRAASEKVRDAAIALRATGNALGRTLPFPDMLSLPDPNGSSSHSQIVDMAYPPFSFYNRNNG